MGTSSVIARREPDGSWRGVSIWLDGTLECVTPALVDRVGQLGSVAALAEVAVDRATTGWRHISIGRWLPRERAAPDVVTPFGPWENDHGLFHGLWVLDGARERVDVFVGTRWLAPLGFDGPRLTTRPAWMDDGVAPDTPETVGLDAFEVPADAVLRALGAVAATLPLPRGPFTFAPSWAARWVRRLVVQERELRIPDDVWRGDLGLDGLRVPNLDGWVERAARLGLADALPDVDTAAAGFRTMAARHLAPARWVFCDGPTLDPWPGRRVVAEDPALWSYHPMEIGLSSARRHYDADAQLGDIVAKPDELVVMAHRFWLLALMHGPEGPQPAVTKGEA